MAEKSIEKRLRALKLFADLEPEELEFLASCATPRSYGKGHVIFQQGAAAKSFFLITEGQISIEIPALEGPTLFLQHISPGQILGWSWLIPPFRWSFLARAESAVDVLEFDGVAILARCEADYKFGYHLLRAFSALMSDRLAHARKRMMEEWYAAGFG